MYKTYTYDDPEQEPSLYEELEENEVFTPGYDKGVFKQVNNRKNNSIKGIEPNNTEKDEINLAFGPKATKDAISSNPQNINWIGYELHSLNQVLTEIKKQKANNKIINTVYINTHGSSGCAALIEGENGSLNAEGAVRLNNGYYNFTDPDKDDKYVYKMDLEWYKNLEEEAKKENRKSGNEKLIAIENLISICNELDNNGTLIFGGCNIGQGAEGKEFIEILFKLTEERINIIANTAPSISTEKRNDIIKKGFMEIATKTRDGVIVSRDTIITPAVRLKYKILLDKGLTEGGKHKTSKGWRIIEPSTNKVRTTDKDLYLQSKDEPYAFKNFEDYNIPAYRLED